jgi:DnaK suppressor protein
VTSQLSAATIAATIPLREGETTWTVEEVQAVTSALHSDKERLSAELELAGQELAALLGTGGGAGDDQADAGSWALEREQALALVHSLRDMVRHCELALERLASGEFGICEDCEKPIGKPRSLAFPRAVKCVACKQREERR